jgi:hypothetical protein
LRGVHQALGGHLICSLRHPVIMAHEGHQSKAVVTGCLPFKGIKRRGHF